ncbi:DUF192 domain-containing protein [Candidatus Saccharibacteria bacterium]|nr:MAG: DUF192 domain-containing protein [Candidatus Saccharibacteria bacterium]
MLNSTLKAAAAKTKLASTHTIIRASPVSGVLLIAMLILLCLVVFLYKPSIKTARLQTEKTQFTLEVAGTEEARLRGLSGWQRLTPNTGMLFKFDVPSAACMWMKDMRLSIDIIWLDEANTIVEIAQKVSPETFPKLFCSAKPAKYVLELPAESAKNQSFYVGQTLDVNIP